MKNKNKIIPIFLFFSILFAMSFIVAEGLPTLQSPDADEYIVGTYNINANIDIQKDNTTIVSFYYRLAAADAWTLIAAVVNTTENQTAYNTSWASTGIVDNTDLEFNATAGNVTLNMSSDTSTGVNIDNGVPTATLASTSLASAVKIYAAQAGTFTLAIDADTTIGVDNCTIHFQTGTANLTTASSNACSSTLYTTSMFALSEGYKSYTIEVMDGNGNKTNSTSRQILIYPGTGISGGAGQGGGISLGGVQEVEITPEEAPEEGGILPSQETLKNFGQKVSETFKKMIDFFKNIFTKKS